jgi:hypothetical protein
VYYSEAQVRATLAHGYKWGHEAPWEAQNSNSGYVASQIEFWTTALTLDDGALLASMNLTDYAQAQIEKWSWFRDHNFFKQP